MTLSRALGFVFASGVALYGTAAGAQTRPTRETESRTTSFRRGRDEQVALYLLAGGYMLRTGTAINLLFDRRPDDGEPETYWILPSALAVGGLVGMFFLDRNVSIRRGRPFAVGTSVLLGYVGALTLTTYVRGERLPSVTSIAGPATWVGSTAGLVTGIMVGHLTDANPGQALYVGTGGVGGALIGAFLCGAARCGTDLGLYAFAGQIAGMALTLSTAWKVNPPAREMRATAVGMTLGTLPALGATFAFALRDGDLSDDTLARVGWFSLAGLIAGGAVGYSVARASRSSASNSPSSANFMLVPMGDPYGLRAATGLSLVGTF
jgi:hypothetical protein